MTLNPTRKILTPKSIEIHLMGWLNGMQAGGVGVGEGGNEWTLIILSKITRMCRARFRERRAGAGRGGFIGVTFRIKLVAGVKQIGLSIPLK
ncbi:hypothetical protein [Cupriavidus sp. TMH.W2]|uniref:hypothetical protein n=1 Tax=Cupriavidus sp. TMH.W2 TaxID=3434465 RepID=UPI003D7819F7